MDQRFPPESRLHNRRDYGRVFHRQQKAAGRDAVVLVAPRPRRGQGATGPRLGVMVSTKVAKRAVRRHQLKRWVRELFRREWRAELDDLDVVVLLRRDPDCGHAVFDDELRRLLGKARASEARPGSGKRPRRRGGGR